MKTRQERREADEKTRQSALSVMRGRVADRAEAARAKKDFDTKDFVYHTPAEAVFASSFFQVFKVRLTPEEAAKEMVLRGLENFPSTTTLEQDEVAAAHRVHDLAAWAKVERLRAQDVPERDLVQRMGRLGPQVKWALAAQRSTGKRTMIKDPVLLAAQKRKDPVLMDQKSAADARKYAAWEERLRDEKKAQDGPQVNSFGRVDQVSVTLLAAGKEEFDQVARGSLKDLYRPRTDRLYKKFMDPDTLKPRVFHVVNYKMTNLLGSPSVSVVCKKVLTVDSVTDGNKYRVRLGDVLTVLDYPLEKPKDLF